MDLYISIFGNRQSDNIIYTPEKIVLEMIEALPTEVWHRDTKFLDPCCKSGIYLKEIRNKLMTSEDLIQAFPDEQLRKVHIETKQLYGLAVSKECLLLSNRNVYGCICANSNIHYIENYISKVKAKNTDYKKLIQEEFNDMTFDVVIGNPPYQESTGGSGGNAKGIYGYFINNAFGLTGRIVSMITPVRWFVFEDKISEQVRRFVLNRNCRNITVFRKAVFDGVGIAGGVGFFVHDKMYKGKTVITEDEHTYLDDITSTNIFIIDRIGRQIVNKIDISKIMAHSALLTDGRSFGLNTYDRGELTYKKNTDYIAIRSSEVTLYSDVNLIEKGLQHLGEYKIIASASGDLKNGLVLNTLELLKPNEVCTKSFIVIQTFDNETQANIWYSYLKTRFIRFLIKLTIQSVGISRKNYKLVPMPNADTLYTDEQLYKKYNLTQEEIDYIEKTIKSMA